MNLSGCHTAIVTPFERGKISFSALAQLVEDQIAAGIAGIVPVGTTGESPTVDMREHKKIIAEVIKTVNNRCLVIAGTGANSTAEAIELTRYAREVGAAASLQVSPYYNKPTQEGLYRHFSTIADTVGLPIVLYNVPGRSGVEISIETIKRLAANPNVVAIKEAGGNADRVSRILSACDLTVLSGDDSLTLPMISLGAKGVISVASNVIPAGVVKLVSAALSGKYAEARKWHYRYYDLFNTLFIETNPIPVKTALALMGKIKEEYRLPLCPITDSNRTLLKTSLIKAGVKLA